MQDEVAMEILQRRYDDVAVLELSGNLHYGAADNGFEETVNELIRQGCVRLVIDLEKVWHIDTACLGLLVAAHLRLQRLGGGVNLLRTPARIRSLLAMVRLDGVLVTFATEEDAVRAFAA